MATVATLSVPRVTRRLEQIVGRPTLTQLQRSGSFTTSAREIVRATMGLDDHVWDQFEVEFREVESTLADRRAKLRPAYPENFAVERETSLLLYGSTRLLKPDRILETGVADGVSTSAFLAALKANGAGELHSVDIAPDVGVLVDDPSRWHLHILDFDSIAHELAELCTQLAPIDLFFHDSDHSFLGQLFDYETFVAFESDRALLISDDVDASYAFDTFCVRHQTRPHYLFDGARKAVGMIRV